MELDAPVLCLTGATATGKSEVGIELARARAAEVVCCDALTVYRGVSILTAKPIAPADVPHRLIDLVEPFESYSAGRFVHDADEAIAHARTRGGDAIVVGGTALYLRVFRTGLGPVVGRDDALRRDLEAFHEDAGPGALWKRLHALDPARAAQLHENDVRRLIRALEITATTGRPASAQRDEWDGPERRRTIVVELVRGEADLARRIDVRTRRMIEAGVVDEVARLAADPRGVSKELAQSIGFKDALERHAGRIDDAELFARIARATRRFSKRQGTFFRGFRALHRVEVAPDADAAAIARVVEATISRLGEGRPYA